MQFEVNILSFPPLFILHPTFVLKADVSNSSGITPLQRKDFFLYDFKQSNNEICISNKFYTTTEITVYIKPYLGMFWEENTWKYLDTWRWRYSVPSEHEAWLRSHAALYFRRRKPSTTLLWKPKNMHPRKLPITSMSNKSLCCVTKLYQAILILAWPGLF